MAIEFISKAIRTTEIDAAIAALRKVPLGMRSSVFAEATADEMKEAFAQQLGKLANGQPSWRRLVGQQRRPEAEPLPGDDHVELWIGSEHTYVSHPYGLKLKELREIVRQCDERGLDVSIDASSWYFPGSTIKVMYKKSQTPEPTPRIVRPAR